MTAPAPPRTRSALYDREAKTLSDSELLDSTFCKEDLDRGHGSWGGKQPTCLFCGKKYRGGDQFAWRCHMDEKLTKESTGKTRPVGKCIPDAEHKARHEEVRDCGPRQRM
jgi:hypothetical protein